MKKLLKKLRVKYLLMFSKTEQFSLYFCVETDEKNMFCFFLENSFYYWSQICYVENLSGLLVIL